MAACPSLCPSPRTASHRVSEKKALEFTPHPIPSQVSGPHLSLEKEGSLCVQDPALLAGTQGHCIASH